MLIALAILCALVEGVFTALEVALGAISRARLRSLSETSQDIARDSNSDESAVLAARDAMRRSERALKLLDDTPHTTLLFITVTSLSLWTATALLTWQALLDNWPSWLLPLALVGILFLAEVLPVLIAAPHAETIALRGAGFVRLAMKVLTPLLALVGGVGRLLARVFGAKEDAAPQVTEEELRTALAAAEEEGAIESGERALLEGAMDFRARLVREVMTTRREICAVPADASLDEVLRVAIEAGHSRLPIYEGTLDKVLGIASTKDLIPHLRKGQEERGQREEATGKGQEHSESENLSPLTPSPSPLAVKDIARPPFFVPETKRIAPMLEELRRQRSLMAIVVDDSGDTVGLVTLEDLLEEIVGDIQDEYDTEEPPLRVVHNAPENDAQQIASDGGVSVREVERFWEKTFGDEAALRDIGNEEADDTISLAALALQLFDGVPQQGERIAAGVLLDEEENEIGALEIEISRMDGPRIEEVWLRRVALPAEGGDAS